MRQLLLACILALTSGTVALAQTPAPSPSAPSPPPASCTPRDATVGGIGRALVVAFTGPIFGDHVCATVANLALGTYLASIADQPSDDALVSASLTGASSIAAVPTGPYVVAPGGQIPDFGGDNAVARRVVLAYAGQRVLVIGTSPVALADLSRALRSQPDLFGSSDAIERATVIASGPDAGLTVQTSTGERWTSGDVSAAHRFLVLTKR